MTITETEQALIISYFEFLLSLNSVQRCRNAFLKRFRELMKTKGFVFRKEYCMNWQLKAQVRKRMRDNHDILREVKRHQEEYSQ